MTRVAKLPLGGARCSWGWRQRRPGRHRLTCEAVFAEHLRTVRKQFDSKRNKQILLAVDDSDAAEEGARFVIQRLAQPGYSFAG